MKTPPIHVHVSISVEAPGDQTPTQKIALHQGEVTIAREPAELVRALNQSATLRRTTSARGL